MTADLVAAGRGILLNVDPETLRDDTALDEWIRANVGTSFHSTGGAAVGVVVDPEGRVLDVDRLRVADLSVLPTQPRRGPAATAFLVAELLSRR